MYLTTRQRFVLAKALSYALANLDDVNDALADVGDPTRLYNGELRIEEGEVGRLLKLFLVEEITGNDSE